MLEKTITPELVQLDIDPTTGSYAFPDELDDEALEAVLLAEDEPRDSAAAATRWKFVLSSLIIPTYFMRYLLACRPVVLEALADTLSEQARVPRVECFAYVLQKSPAYRLRCALDGMSKKRADRVIAAMVSALVATRVDPDRANIIAAVVVRMGMGKLDRDSYDAIGYSFINP